MNFIEISKQSLISLAANKLRSSLTLLAIVVGVFAIISSTTAVLVIHTYFTQTLSFLGGNVLNITKYPSVRVNGGRSEYRNRADIDFTTLRELKDRLPFSAGISPNETFTTTKVSHEGNETEPNISIRGSNQYYLENNSYDLAAGRNFTAQDIQHRRALAIIGSEIKKDLFKTQDPLGKSIRVDGRSYQIIGITKSKGSVFGNSLDDFVLMPYTTLMNVYGKDRNISIQVQAPAITLVAAMKDELTGVLRTIRKVAPGHDNDFEIETNQSLSGAFDQFTGILSMAGYIIGFIALLGAGIGVMNIMLVSVTERTREIGIRKAVGATKKTIILQFLMEAVLICEIGGVIGLLLGVLGGNLLAFYMQAHLVFPWGAALGGVVAMSLLGIIFGVYPAWKAAQLDPIESLRYE